MAHLTLCRERRFRKPGDIARFSFARKVGVRSVQRSLQRNGHLSRERVPILLQPHQHGAVQQGLRRTGRRPQTQRDLAEF